MGIKVAFSRVTAKNSCFCRQARYAELLFILSFILSHEIFFRLTSARVWIAWRKFGISEVWREARAVAGRLASGLPVSQWVESLTRGYRLAETQRWLVHCIIHDLRRQQGRKVSRPNEPDAVIGPICCLAWVKSRALNCQPMTSLFFSPRYRQFRFFLPASPSWQSLSDILSKVVSNQTAVRSQLEYRFKKYRDITRHGISYGKIGLTPSRILAMGARCWRLFVLVSCFISLLVTCTTPRAIHSTLNSLSFRIVYRYRFRFSSRCCSNICPVVSRHSESFFSRHKIPN